MLDFREVSGERRLELINLFSATRQRLLLVGEYNVRNGVECQSYRFADGVYLIGSGKVSKSSANVCLSVHHGIDQSPSSSVTYRRDDDTGMLTIQSTLDLSEIVKYAELLRDNMPYTTFGIEYCVEDRHLVRGGVL